MILFHFLESIIVTAVYMLSKKRSKITNTIYYYLKKIVRN